MAANGPVGGEVAVTDLADRNRRIVEAHVAGESMVEIGRRHGLSTERIRQVVRRAEGRPPSRRRRSGTAASGERVRLRHRQPGKGGARHRAGVPGSEGRVELAEELVRMLIRVRRHLPGKVRRR